MASGQALGSGAGMVQLAHGCRQRHSCPHTVLACLHGAWCVCMQAPEVWRNEPYNEKVDVFSFGVLLYELLACGMLLFTHVRSGKLMGCSTAGALWWHGPLGVAH